MCMVVCLIHMTYRGPSDAASALEGYVPFPDDRAGRYVDEGHWRNLRFHDVLDDRAAENGDDAAVIDHRRELTYAELAENSERVAGFLHGELGLGPLDRVVFQLPNRAEFLEALFACSRIGAIPVMMLPRHREAEVEHIVDLTDAKALVTVDETAGGYDFVGVADDVAADSESLEHLVAVTGGEDPLPDGWDDFNEVLADGRYDGDDSDVEAIEVNPHDPGVFLLSGGTTGLPKPIPRTHNDYVFQWRKIAEEMGIRGEWTGFASVPAAHNASLVVVLGPAIWVGATVGLEPRLKPEALMELIERTDGTWSLPIPTQLIDILDHPAADDYDLSSLELLVSGGQKVPPRVVYDAVERWDVEFGNVFGMAEGPIIITRPGDDVDLQAHTVGYPVAPEADEVRLVDTTDRDREVPPGEKGELSVRGPGYFTGYFRNPEENAANFDDEGWFYTEDVLMESENGYYEVHGRLKDTIIRGGENIYAPGVEDELIEHPRISNVAVVGKRDERLGERPLAFLELADEGKEITVEELSEWLDDRGMAVFKHPEFVRIVENLPRTEVQKIDKQALRERLRAEAAGGE